VFEINYALLRSDVDIVAIDPDMLIYARRRQPGHRARAGRARRRTAHEPRQAHGNGPDVHGLRRQETFVNPATGGDMQKGPSEPFRTAAGASMLRGDAALPFKDVVRNFDVFTESVISSLILFNHKFNDNPKVKGDFSPSRAAPRR
jgi:hypothetical protein